MIGGTTFEDRLGRTNVLFVAGYVRSGSTLLDRLVGSIEGFLSLGEVSLVWDYGFRQNRSCACGRSFRDCRFWNEVADEAFGGITALDVREVLRARAHVDRWWRLPQLMWGPMSEDFRADVTAHVEVLGRLYRAVRTVSGCDVIVDSSKEPSHLRFLQLLEPSVRSAVVHLVRDSRAVAYSLCERDRFDPSTGRDLDHHMTLRAAGAWTITNLLVEAAKRGSPRRLLLRYEDVVTDPRSSLERVLRLIGGPRELPTGWDGSERLGINHSVAGNPMRFEHGPISVRLDDEWRRRMSRRRKAVVTALTWPQLVAYGSRARSLTRTSA